MYNHTPLNQKSTVDDIRQRFDNDVERFSNLDTGQQTTIDAPLTLKLASQAAFKSTPNAKRILDIGCGAGNNTLMLLKSINTLHCDLIDVSQPMLERAHQRVSAETTGNVTTHHTDIRNFDCNTPTYDIIVAASVLHHLRDEQDWQDVFQKCYNILNPGGSFWITDLVSQDTPPIQNLMNQQYAKYLTDLGGKELQEFAFDYIDKEDSPRSVTFQMNLLQSVGFNQVEILHKNACFAAFGAIKSN